MMAQAALRQSAEQRRSYYRMPARTKREAQLELVQTNTAQRELHDYRSLIALPPPQLWGNERRKFPRVEVQAALLFENACLPVLDISSAGMRLANDFAYRSKQRSPFEADLFFQAASSLYRQKLFVQFVDYEAPFPCRLLTCLIIDGAEPYQV